MEGGHHREFGRAEIVIQKASAPARRAWARSDHRETGVDEPRRQDHRHPAGLRGRRHLAKARPSPSSPTRRARFYGIQFHPEVVHTPRGALMLRNFTHGIAGLNGDWTMAAYRDEQIAKIRAQVGDAKVICGLSGGVDSSVAAVLIHEAIGDQLTCVFVDTGLLRKDEATQVMTLFREHYNIPLIHVDASEEFLGAAGGGLGPGDQAQDHRPGVHRGVRPRGRQDRGRRLPGPGHPLSRRDRERLGLAAGPRR